MRLLLFSCNPSQFLAKPAGSVFRKSVTYNARLSIVIRAAMTATLIAFSAVAQPNYPADFPATPYPDIKGCSSEQTAYLKEAWRLAHYYTWRTDHMLQRLKAQPVEERERLWSSDFRDTAAVSTSPSNYFGAYNAGRVVFISEAVNKALRRFEQRGSIVKGIRTLRCGQPIAPKSDEHTDVCPAGNPGGNGSPSAYHAPVGVIVTCPESWQAAFDKSVDKQVRLHQSARKMVHEIFHWLSVDGKYVKDRHGDGVGGHEDKKYYGVDNVDYLAKNKPGWSTVNNDSYAYFVANTGNAETTYSVVWTQKEGSGTGGFFLDLTWEQLVAKWNELAAGQYLADVSSYIKNGERRYTAVWRVGQGTGALYRKSWPDFAAKFNELKDTQDLIDIEVIPSGKDFEYLGVWRKKQPGAKGDGGLLNSLTWDGLVSRWKEFGKNAYLCDVETYVKDGKRFYVGVWRAGSGNGALLQTGSWDDFAKYKQSQNKTQDLIDFERYLSDDGKWRYLGVWRDGSPSGVLHATLTRQEFATRREEYKSKYTLLDVEVLVPLPERLK